MIPVLHSVRVGVPRRREAGGETWMSSFYKDLVSGPVRLERENLAGDRQADLTVHGGPEKAVCVYSGDHYAEWRQELGVWDGGPGWFGENFTVTDQTEQTVVIGDVYRVGSALVQVSQPRGPCWKLAQRWGRLDLPKRVVRSGRSGWYLRVLEPGEVSAGQPFVLENRDDDRWTIAMVNRLTYARGHDRASLRDLRHALAESPALAENWRDGLLDADD
jgi:MOSC domain-containing protein YiiM